MPDTEESERALLAALSHEIGNLLAAIRLSAHLLSQDGEKVERYAQQIDDLAAQAGALLAHVRPLASGLGGTRMDVGVGELLAGVEQVVAGGGRGGLSVERARVGDAKADVDPERLHNALVLLVLGAMESSGAEGAVRISAGVEGDWVRFAVEDDGAPIEPEASGPEARGRTLAVHVVREVLGRDGGGVELPNPARGGQVVVKLPRS